MSRCDVCGNEASRPTTVSEVFRVEGRMVLVENVPARVCTRCGELTFDRKSAERIRRMVHGEGTVRRHITMDVFAYA